MFNVTDICRFLGFCSISKLNVKAFDWTLINIFKKKKKKTFLGLISPLVSVFLCRHECVWSEADG